MVPVLASLPAVIALLGAAIVIPWDKTINTEPFPRNTTATENCGPIDDLQYSRRTVYFPSKGLQLEGWLYLPKVLLVPLPGTQTSAWFGKGFKCLLI